MGNLAEAFRFNRVIAANLRVKIASELIVKVGRFVLIVVAARALGPERFGLYAFAFSFASILVNGSDFGLHLHLAREVAGGETGPGAALGQAIRAKAYLTLAVGVLLAACVILYPRPIETRLLLLLAGAALLSQSWCDLWNHYFRGLQSLREEAGLNLLNTVVGTGLGILVLATGRGVLALFGALLAASILTNLVAVGLIAGRKLLPERASARLALHTIRQAVPIGIAILLSTLYFRIDMIFLEQMRTASEVGTYGAAYRLLESFLFLPALLLAALYPALAEESRRDLAELRRLYRTGLRTMAVLSLALLAGIALLAPVGLRILYGERYREAAPLLRMLAVSLPFIFPNYVLMHLLVATRGQKWNALFAAIGVIVNVGLNIPAVRLYGAMGAAVVTAVTEAILLLLGLFAVRRQLTLLEARRP